MRLFAMLVVLTICGCAPMGGQAVTGYADHGGIVTMHIYISDGGTDLGGLFYRPSGGTVTRVETDTAPAAEPYPEPLK